MTRIVLHHIAFTGPRQTTARLEFGERPTFVYGASNTGKSFSLKAIDFMLGGDSLPAITQAKNYDTAWLALTLPSGHAVTLSRATSGGEFHLHKGIREAPDPHEQPTVLRARHAPGKTDTLSHLLLNELGLTGKRIAKNKSGTTENFTFRNIAPFILLHETEIQAERSPVSSGQRDDTKEQSAFRLMISGKDDKAIVAKLTPPAFKASKTAKIEALTELIASTDLAIAQARAALSGEDDRSTLEARLVHARQLWEGADGSLHAHIEHKRDLARHIFGATARQEDITIHLARFEQLAAVYASDIARLDALEEAGFLLTLGEHRDCPLCGAAAAAQTKSHGTEMIEEIKAATVAEIAKIKRLRADLDATIADLNAELRAIGPKLQTAQQDLAAVEAKISKLLPTAKEHERALAELISRRDAANRIAQLAEQKTALLAKRAEYEAMKQSRKDRPKLVTPANEVYEFGKIVGSILKEWKFPGGADVTFDEATYDIKIDGVLRTLNGKGVRALTHAAFKVGLLLYCQQNSLPHPGFMVLDTPLLAYRDPVKSKAGPLSDDEKIIVASPVQQNFFRHLASLKGQAQFIILDNIDPPANIEEWADTELFTGNPDAPGRFGFFN
jgi:hypothetical protein